MRKTTIKVIFISLLALILITGCSQNKTTTHKTRVDEETIKKKNTEIRFMEIEKAERVEARNYLIERMDEYTKKLDAGDDFGIALTTGGKTSQSYYTRYGDDPVINSLYNYMSATQFIDYGEKEKARYTAALIDPNYDGVYSERILKFTKNLLGSNYEKLWEEAKQKRRNYNDLTSGDRAQIQMHIQSELSKNKGMKKVWAEVVRISEISEMHVDWVWTGYTGTDGPDLIYHTGVIEAYPEDEVAIYYNTDYAQQYIEAEKQGDNETMNNLISKNKVAILDNITYLVIGESTNTPEELIKVKIRSGLYDNNEVYVLKENVKKPN
jgi:hypothetical protein